jgi:hypothetical protein
MLISARTCCTGKSDNGSAGAGRVTYQAPQQQYSRSPGRVLPVPRLKTTAVINNSSLNQTTATQERKQMNYTLQFAWAARASKTKLITLSIPAGPSPKPEIEVHPLHLPLADLHDMAEACQAAERIAASHTANAIPTFN